MEAQNYQEDRPEDIIAETKAELSDLSEEVVAEQEKKVEIYMQKILKKAESMRQEKYSYGT
ncbi:MAG: hypothetical protein WCL02_01565 [bacterium]